MKKCLPICNSNFSSVKNAVEKYSSRYDLMEIWLDYLEPLDIPALKQFIAEKEDIEFILLFRRKGLENSVTPIDVQKKCIDELQGSNILWDFDIGTQQTELSYYRKNPRSSKLLCSYHNYGATPEQEELLKLVQRMEDFDPDIVKFACFCEEESDSLRLLCFLLELKKKEKGLIVLGMGEKGMITRVFSEQFGNDYLFLSVRDDKDLGATAPGQLTLEDFEEIQSTLGRVVDGG